MDCFDDSILYHVYFNHSPQVQCFPLEFFMAAVTSLFAALIMTYSCYLILCSMVLKDQEGKYLMLFFQFLILRKIKVWVCGLQYLCFFLYFGHWSCLIDTWFSMWVDLDELLSSWLKFYGLLPFCNIWYWKNQGFMSNGRQQLYIRLLLLI